MSDDTTDNKQANDTCIVLDSGSMMKHYNLKCMHASKSTT